MKIIDCEQNTPAWVEARLGIPTASRFDKIITPKKLELSKSADMLICELIAERRLGQFGDRKQTDWMNRGSNLEDIAADDYAFTHDVDLQRVGFITTDDGLIGCSPDRLIVGQRAGLEIKNPSAAKHMSYILAELGILDLPTLLDEHRCQVLGSLWITGFEYWDLMSYHPYLPRVIVRCEPDAAFNAAMNEAMYGENGFLERYRKACEGITTVVEARDLKERLAASA
jgi:hypothetical protein